MCQDLKHIVAFGLVKSVNRSVPAEGEPWSDLVHARKAKRRAMLQKNNGKAAAKAKGQGMRGIHPPKKGNVGGSQPTTGEENTADTI